MGNLRTDFKDDIFQGNRKYIQVKNDDGTVSFVDATQYEQEGDYFGSADVNATNAKVNENETAIAGKAASVHKHTKADISDFPSSMPASDVYAWAKAATKPTYTASEVGALAVNAKAVDSDKLGGIQLQYEPGAWGLRIASMSTTDLVAGSSNLNKGYIYIVYE